MNDHPVRLLCLIACLTLVYAAPGWAREYDPLATEASARIQTVDLTVVDRERQREIPLRVYLPVSDEPAAVVLFSHGLGGSRENNPYLGQHWAGRGYAVVFMQHPGSDEAVWKDVPARERMAAMTRAANAQNAVLRFRDVPAVIDQLEVWNADADSPLHGRLDLDRLGMSGHSFGAVTTQAVSGQTMRGPESVTDDRIKAAVLMSPSTPRGGDAGRAFAEVRIPWLLMTGTLDTSPIGGADLASRLAVYPALPEGDKYQVVLDGAQHSAFSEGSLRRDAGGRNPNHHRVILALSTAFWDAYLNEDAEALGWLRGDGPRSVMQPGDRWDRK